MRPSLFLLTSIAALGVQRAGTVPPARADDLRAAYDVQAYRLDLVIDPEHEKLSGVVAVEAVVTSTALATLELDLQPGFEVSRVLELESAVDSTSALKGRELAFRRAGARLGCALARPMQRGEPVRIAVVYSGRPTAPDSFEGFHWQKTAEGRPWISTSCQGRGSSSWWPCKDSFFHPEDKPERTFVNATVPSGLYAVSNGRLALK
jgi:aminopeptidase N